MLNPFANIFLLAPGACEQQPRHDPEENPDRAQTGPLSPEACHLGSSNPFAGIFRPAEAETGPQPPQHAETGDDEAQCAICHRNS